MLTCPFPADADMPVGTKDVAVTVTVGLVFPSSTVMPVCSPMYLTFPLESFPNTVSFLFEPAGTLVILPE